MKKIILVGIDFSKGSMHALKIAIGIANKAQANVMLVHVMKPQREDSIFTDDRNELRKEAKKRLEEIISRSRFELRGGKLMYKIRSGKVDREIINQAKYHDAFLIAVGTHGISGFEPFWVGSNAYRIVTGAPCPVITIRYGEDAKRNISKIVLPIDSTKESRQKVPFTAVLANMFSAEVVILGLVTSEAMDGLIDSYCKQVEKYLLNEGIINTIHKRHAENLTDEAINFARDISADLIVIMTEQETTLSNLLLGSYAQQMINHSELPVLSLRSRNLYDFALH
ncbi:MAG TPA: universal stress protein [Bacteroidales bacterium]|nr:universal stress protein [Bacteroidales bacterium]HRZ49798.1 universal stress protein [Bacteroidales bacterium]